MKIRYFAWLKHRVGRAEEEIALPAGIDSLDRLKTFLAARHPGFAEALASPGVVRCAINQEHVPGDAPLQDGDEVAFFPPVTGG
ncbi:MAG: molybdopterin converting factor subunit 1 [Geminicoccaceae bacterium]